jgi:hypothetical protein
MRGRLPTARSLIADRLSWPIFLFAPFVFPSHAPLRRPDSSAYDQVRFLGSRGDACRW